MLYKHQIVIVVMLLEYKYGKSSEIRADKAFEKNVKDHVVKGGRKTLCISISGSQVVFSGEENCVVVAQENKKVNS